MCVYHSQLYFEQYALVLPYMYPPAAVLSLSIPLWPVRRQDNTPWTCQVPPTQSWRWGRGKGEKGRGERKGEERVREEGREGRKKGESDEISQLNSVSDIRTLSTHTHTQPHNLLPTHTFAEWFRVVPVWISGIDTLYDGRPLLQGVTRITAELHHSSNSIDLVSGAEVTILQVGLITVPTLKSCRGEGKERRGGGDG